MAVDRDRWALADLATRVAARYPAAHVAGPSKGTSRSAMPGGPFDGVLAANSLHFVADLAPILASIRASLVPRGRLVLVEYDAEHGNPLRAAPASRGARWEWLRTQPPEFTAPRLLHRVPSRFLGSIYGAASQPGGWWQRVSDSAGSPRVTLPALTATTERSRSGDGPGASAGRCEPRGHDGREGRSRAVRMAPDSAPRGCRATAGRDERRVPASNQQVVPRPRSSAGRAGRFVSGASPARRKPAQGRPGDRNDAAAAADRDSGQGLRARRLRARHLRALAGRRRLRPGRRRLHGGLVPAALRHHPAAAQRDRQPPPRARPAHDGRGPDDPPRPDARAPGAVPARAGPRQHRRAVRARRDPGARG